MQMKLRQGAAAQVESALSNTHGAPNSLGNDSCTANEMHAHQQSRSLQEVDGIFKLRCV